MKDIEIFQELFDIDIWCNKEDILSSTSFMCFYNLLKTLL